MAYDEMDRDILRRKAGISDKSIDDMEKRQASMEKINRMNKRDVSDEDVRQFRENQERLHRISSQTDPETSYKERDGQWYYERSPEYEADQKFKAEQAKYKKSSEIAEKASSRMKNFKPIFQKKARIDKYRKSLEEQKREIEATKSTDDYAHERKRLEVLASKRRRFDNERGMLGSDDQQPVIGPWINKKLAGFSGTVSEEPIPGASTGLRLNYEGFMRPSEKQYVKDKIARAKEKISKIIEDRNKFDDLDREKLKIELAKAGVDMREENNIREINNINSKKDLKDYLKSLKTSARIVDKVNQHEGSEDISEEIRNSAFIGMEKYNRDMLISPIKTPIKMSILGISEDTTQNIVSQKIKSIFDGFNDKDYLENGASPADITQLRLLEDRYNAAKYANDTGLQNELGRRIILTKGKINRDVLTNKRADASERAKLRREELENEKLIAQIQATKYPYGKPKSKKEELKDLKLVTNLRDLKTTSYGRPIATNPAYSGYGQPVNIRQDYNVAFARDRIAQRRQALMNEEEMRRMKARDADAELQSAFSGTDRIVAMVNGNYAPSKARLGNLPSVGAIPKNKSVSPVARVGQIDIAMPKVNMTLGLHKRVPMANKPQGGRKVSPQLNQTNITSRIASGIEGMIAPHKAMAAAHKDRVYHSPECAIANICGNVRSAASAHRNHAKNFTNIGVGIGSYGVGKPVVKKPAMGKPSMGSFDVKLPNIQLPSMKKKKSGKK